MQRGPTRLLRRLYRWGHDPTGAGVVTLFSVKKSVWIAVRSMVAHISKVRFMLNYVMMPIVFPLMGEMVHTLDVGAKTLCRCHFG